MRIEDGRRCLLPDGGAGCRSGDRRPWRKRPRCTRPKWPRARPEGRSRHGCLCRCRCPRSLVGRRGAPCASAIERARSGSTCSGRTDLGFPANVGSGTCYSAACRGSSCFPESVARNVPHALLTCRPPCLASRAIILRCDGHHDDDGASVLGTVQGSALRSDRARARPSGLDGACAQMIRRHLRDGHRMLFPSGTNGALIDPSDGLEKRSYLVRRFRTRAFRPLAEAHFSRFCPLTSVASGASLFAFDGAATHHPSRSVTDAKQPLIVAPRAAITWRPSTRDIGNDTADRRRTRARPPRLRLAGHSRRRGHRTLVFVRTARPAHSAGWMMRRLAPVIDRCE